MFSLKNQDIIQLNDDVSVFDNWSNEMAYFLGLFITDGCVVSYKLRPQDSGFQFSQKTDELLIKWKKFL